MVGITEPGTSGAGNVNETLTNTTTIPIAVTYSYITTASVCSNAGDNVVVTVDPVPVITAAQAKTICDGAAVNYKVTLTPAGLPAGTTYNWSTPTMSDASIQGSAGVAVPEASALTITDILANTTGSPITATYNITPTGPSGCVGAPVNVVVTINPAPVITAGQTKTICNGAAVNYKVTLTPGGLPCCNPRCRIYCNHYVNRRAHTP